MNAPRYAYVLSRLHPSEPNSLLSKPTEYDNAGAALRELLAMDPDDRARGWFIIEIDRSDMTWADIPADLLAIELGFPWPDHKR